jgi:hypothetical protein
MDENAGGAQLGAFGSLIGTPANPMLIFIQYTDAGLGRSDMPLLGVE